MRTNWQRTKPSRDVAPFTITARAIRLLRLVVYAVGKAWSALWVVPVPLPAHH